MTTFFISRHPGAINWMKHQSIRVDRWLPHLNPKDIRKGDIVIGTLPIHLAFQVCRRGARFLALRITIPQEKRGIELSMNDMQGLDCRLDEYVITKHAWEPSA